LETQNAHGDYDAAIAKAAAAVTHVQSLSQEVCSGDEGLGLFGFDLPSAETELWWLGEVQSRRNRNQYTASTWGHGSWLQKKLENLSAAPDELDDCPEARDFASHFRVSYCIFLSTMEAAKPVFSVCTHDGGCAYWAAEPKYTHVFCRRFRSPYVFWSSSSPCWRDSRSGITVCNKQRV
ncbi:unnamed protein product, partial [Ascophyllum nodosum]